MAGMAQTQPAGSSPADTAMPRRILCIGIPVLDLTFRVKAVPARGMKFSANHFSQICGGNALNAAIGISRLGGHARLTGPMGHEGETSSGFMFELLAAEGIDASALVHMPGLITPVSAIMIDPTGERTIVSFRDPLLWQVALPDADRLLRGINAIVIESRCAGFATGICAAARAHGIPVIVDIDSTMAPDDGLLAASSHLIFSEQALQDTTGLACNEQALREIATRTPAFVAATRGAQGTIWLDPHGEVRETPAFPVRPVDTLGAGDIFHGAFALGITEGMNVPAALRFASAAAALKCTRFGGAFACPERSEVDRLLSDSTG